MPVRRPYQHPGRLFIAQYGLPRRVEDVLAYARFLRQERFAIPVKVESITWRHGIRREFLNIPGMENMEGFTDHELGIIYVNQRYSEERQRFTVAHELIEMLYSACRESPEWAQSIFAANSIPKERLCNKGAAALLLPQRSMRIFLSETPPSLKVASNLTTVYKTSLTACVHRMVELSSNPCAMIVWRLPSDSEKETAFNYNQHSLQVWWSEVSEGTNWRIPHKQTSPALVNQVYATGRLLTGSENLTIGNWLGNFAIEAQRVTYGAIRCVLSLIRPEIPGATIYER